jgi:hypothetical protein
MPLEFLLSLALSSILNGREGMGAFLY